MLDKRIVVLLTSGPRAGLHLIDGTVQQAEAHLKARLPDFIPELTVFDRTFPAGMVKTTPRYVLYKECASPAPQASA